MDSEDTMTILQLHSSTMLRLDDEDEIDTSHSHYLSRLSMCTTSSSGTKPPTLTPTMFDDDGDVGCDGITDMGLGMSRLSIESSSEGDADEEFSDGKEGGNKGVPAGMSSDSDKETSCYSLPATPPPRRRRSSCPCGYGSENLLAMGLKEYASDNDAQKRTSCTTTTMRRKRSWFRRTPTTATSNYCSSPSSSSYWTKGRLAGPAMMRDRDRWGMERAWNDEKNNQHHNKYGNVKEAGEGEEEEEEDGGSECLVITRPKGGKRSLCMDLEEVKACRDLGFELDHEKMMMMMVDTPNSTPGRISISVPAASTIDFDTSSGGNSPIANWRISSPGDDPRDVKARLKMWAQAVAIASTSRHVSS